MFKVHYKTCLIFINVAYLIVTNPVAIRIHIDGQMTCNNKLGDCLTEFIFKALIRIFNLDVRVRCFRQQLPKIRVNCDRPRLLLNLSRKRYKANCMLFANRDHISKKGQV